METRIKTDHGDVPIRKTEMARGNPALAAAVSQAGGGQAVEGTERKTIGHAPAVQQNVATESLDEIPYSERNPVYFNVSSDLPSRFIFYPYNTLSIRPLRLQEAKKIFQAQSMESMRMIVEAVTSCLQPGLSAFDLTVGDFYFLLYWLRIQSFKKSPYTLNFTCTNYAHVEQVVKKEKERASLFNEVVVHSVGDLKIINPNYQKIEDQIDLISNEYGLDVYPVLMRDQVEVDEMSQRDADGNVLVDAEGKPLPPSDDVLWTAKYASVLSPYKHGRTIQERMEYFDNLDTSPDLLGDLDFFIQLTDHGVQEQTKLACRGCNAMVDVKVSINALTFFPTIQRP